MVMEKKKELNPQSGNHLKECSKERRKENLWVPDWLRAYFGVMHKNNCVTVVLVFFFNFKATY